MTMIQQDTQAVHLAGEDGKALCSAPADALVLIEAKEWTAGFTSASQGARVCRDCEEKAGTAAVFAPGEREAEDLPSGFTPQDFA